MKPVIPTLLILLASSFAVGCGDVSPGQDEAKMKGSTPSAGSALSGDTSNSSNVARPGGPSSQDDSVYTDLSAEKCKTIEVNENEEWSVQKCDGAFGYSLEVAEGDLRQTITVIAPNGKRHDLDLWSVVSGGFSAVGEKAEWRFRTEGGSRVPFALIVRFNVSEDPENPEKATSYLTVSKITDGEICVTDVVKPVANANVKARELAAGAGERPCLKKD